MLDFRNNLKSKIKHIAKNIFADVFLALPFVAMEIYIRYLSQKTNYDMPQMQYSSIFFSVVWIAFIICMTRRLPRVAGRIFYGISFIASLLLFLTHCVYFLYTGFFFCFRLLQSADEGSSYIWDILVHTDPWVYAFCAGIFVVGVLGIIIIPKKKSKSDIRKTLMLCTLFLATLMTTPDLLGEANSSLRWDNWRNPRNVYQNFNDSNKCMKICGMYEYTFRDIYVTFLKAEAPDDPEELAFLKDIYKEASPHKKNQYTGLFEGKNVIFLQLEGIDSWLLNRKDMPNTYGLLKNSINFVNHYSYYNGGGSTFNSELAVTTGFFSPLTYSRNPYTFNNNLFDNTLPKKLKEKGYAVNAFHMNTGEFYAREPNYKNWGYDNYYSLIDDEKRTDIKTQFDTELILDESFYKKIFGQKQPFMDYIITYTAHTPFSLKSPMGKALAKKVYGDEKPPVMTEEEVARFFAKETDAMVGLLIQALKDNDLYDNTVIVAFADHYLYTLNDKTILDKYKRTDNNLINNTPFFIWSSDLRARKVNKVNSQMDILPTCLNLFGIEFDDNHYIGNDIFEKDFMGYVFFSDFSWYDGMIYVENGEVTEGRRYKEEYVLELNDLINKKIQQNDLTLKYDYFRRMKKTK